MKILFAEDDADLRAVVTKLLRALGYEVHEAQDGLEAVELQRMIGAELLITDVIMPRQDGLRTILAFREEFPRTRIIACSGGGTIRGVNTLEAARLAGADATYQKGCDLRTLLAIISEFEHATALSASNSESPILCSVKADA